MNDNYIIQVSTDGVNWGTSHWGMGTYNLDDAKILAARLETRFNHVQILKQTITWEPIS